MSDNPNEVKTPQHPVVNMRCRKEGCKSITAYNETPPEAPRGQNLYRCTECKWPWGISVGGGINI